MLAAVSNVAVQVQMGILPVGYAATLPPGLPPNLRQFLNELPETLDETYERNLKGINKAQKGQRPSPVTMPRCCRPTASCRGARGITGIRFPGVDPWVAPYIEGGLALG